METPTTKLLGALSIRVHLCPSMLENSSLCRLQHRQQHAKRRSFPHLAIHFDFAPVGLNNHLALEHADAEPVLLGGLKRTKEQTLNKIASHPATTVRDAQDHPAVALAGFDSNLALVAHCVPRIERQV